MGANMQRQAVPLPVLKHPLVGTGMEYTAATDSVFAYWHAKLVKLYVAGVMKSTFFAIAMVVLIPYRLNKFLRSNQSHVRNQNQSLIVATML